MTDGQPTLDPPSVSEPEEPQPESTAGGAASDPDATPDDLADIAATEFTYQDELAPPLWPADEGQALTRRWERAQDAFIDTPRDAVAEIDSLVALLATRIPELFADERARLEGLWERGDEVPADDLRIALLRYRAFFGGLLAS